MTVWNTVKPVTQSAGYTGFLGIEGRVMNEGGLYSRAGKNQFLPCKI